MKRSFMKMKNIFAAVIFLVSVFCEFVSCSNLYDAGRENSTQNSNDKNNTMCTITGSVSPGSALPSELCSIFNQNINSSKTAFPSVPTSGVSLQITAMNNDDDSMTYTADCDTSTFPWSFELNMPVGSYTLTAELSQNSKVIMSYKDTCVVLTESDPILNKEILLDAKQTSGVKGKLSLLIKDETTIGLGEIKFNYKIASENFSFEDKSALIDTHGLISGSYSASIEFYKNGEIIYKIPLEKINVFDNMTTDTWYKNGQEPYLQQNDDGTASCVITDDCINRYAITNIWVHPTKGNDDNSGDGSAPVQTIKKAAEIVYNSSSVGPFTINLVEGEHSVSSQITFNKTVTFEGASMEGTVINDSGSNSFIMVNSFTGSSAFEISLNNLTYKFSADKTANSGLLSIQNTGGFKSFNLKNVCATNGSSEKKIKKPLIQTNQTVQLNIDNCKFSNLKLRPTDSFNINDSFNPLIKSTGTTTIKNTVFENIDVELTAHLKGMIWCTNITTFEKVYFYSNSIKDHVSSTNFCDVRGGMIYNQGTLTLDHVTFGVDSNKNDKPIEIKNGGNIYGGLVYNEKAMTCTNCNFINCQMQNAKQDLRIAGAVYSTTANSADNVRIQFSTFLKNSAANSNKIWGTGLCVYPSANINPVVKLGNSIYFDDSSDIYLGVGEGSDNNTYNGQLELGSGMQLWDSFNGKTMSYFATISSSLDDSGNYNTTVPVMTGDVGHMSRYFKVKPTGTGDDAINWKIKEVTEGSGSVGKFAYDIDTVSSIGAGDLAAWLSVSNNKVIGVESAEDIIALANLTEETFEGKTIKLVNEIELDDSFITPFGYEESTPFKGIIDGSGKTINFNNAKCLIVYLKGTEDPGDRENCKIMNLKTSGTIAGSESLILYASDSFVIENCVTGADVPGVAKPSGLIGSYHTSIDNSCVEIINCINNGTIGADNPQYAAGLVNSIGGGNVTFSNCHNTGIIRGKKGCFAGLVAMVSSNVVINNCSNTGDVGESINDSNGSNFNKGSGGLVGQCYINSTDTYKLEIKNSFNTGKIQGYHYVGGIVGYAKCNETDKIVEIKNCYNSNEIMANTSQGKAGGILGYAEISEDDLRGCTMINCVNYGNVTGNQIGGCFVKDSGRLSTLSTLYYKSGVVSNGKAIYDDNDEQYACSYQDSDLKVSLGIWQKDNLIEILNQATTHTQALNGAEGDYFRWTRNTDGDPVLDIPTN